MRHLSQGGHQPGRVDIDQLVGVARDTKFGDEPVREFLGPPGRDETRGRAGEPGQPPVQAVRGGGPEQPEGGVGAGAVAEDGDVVGVATEVRVEVHLHSDLTPVTRRAEAVGYHG